MKEASSENKNQVAGGTGPDQAAVGEAPGGIWSKAYNRLEQTQVSLERGFQPIGEQRQAILEERAKALAWKPEERANEEQIIVIEFQLADETYGIESGYIREVHPLTDLTPLPCTPPFVLGVINVHGQILSVLDLKRFLDLPDKGLTDLNRIIVLSSGDMEFGILADAIFGLKTIPVGEIQPSLPTLTDIKGDFLLGITVERTVILDGKKILTDPRIIVHEEVETV